MAIRYRTELIDFRGTTRYPASGRALPVSDRHASTLGEEMKEALNPHERHFFFGFFAGCSYLMIIALRTSGGISYDIYFAFSSVINVVGLVVSDLFGAVFKIPALERSWYQSQIPALSSVVIPILLVAFIPDSLGLIPRSMRFLVLILFGLGFLSVLVGSYYLPSPPKKAPNKTRLDNPLPDPCRNDPRNSNP